MVACGEEDDGESSSQVDTILALTGDATSGGTLYSSTCSGCHGADGKGGSFDESVVGETPRKIASIVLSGEGSMPSYKDSFSDQEIADIIAHINTL